MNKVVEVNQLNPNEEQVSLVVKEMSGVYEDPEAFKIGFCRIQKKSSGRSDSFGTQRCVLDYGFAVVEQEEIDAAELLSDAAKGTEVGARNE